MSYQLLQRHFFVGQLLAIKVACDENPDQQDKLGKIILGRAHGLCGKNGIQKQKYRHDNTCDDATHQVCFSVVSVKR